MRIAEVITEHLLKATKGLVDEQTKNHTSRLGV
jgi:hypothetical protein